MTRVTVLGTSDCPEIYKGKKGRREKGNEGRNVLNSNSEGKKV